VKFQLLSAADHHLIKFKDPLFKKFQKMMREQIHQGSTPQKSLNGLTEHEK
jgi:hypothetical protein